METVMAYDPDFKADFDHWQDAADGDPYARMRAPAWRTATQPMVLVVDDEGSIAELLCELLETSGYRTVRASNGRNGLMLARALHPELVLTDALMPELDGPGLILALRADAATDDIPVVMMSSTRPNVAAMRDVPFLAKPFDLDDVLEVVGSHLAHPGTAHPRRARRQPPIRRDS